MKEQETLFVRSAHRMERESRVTLAYDVTKLGLKVIVSYFFQKDYSLLNLRDLRRRENESLWPRSG